MKSQALQSTTLAQQKLKAKLGHNNLSNSVASSQSRKPEEIIRYLKNEVHRLRDQNEEQSEHIEQITADYIKEKGANEKLRALLEKYRA
jgi:flagellar biosynthesis chaperone FliJ